MIMTIIDIHLYYSINYGLFLLFTDEMSYTAQTHIVQIIIILNKYLPIESINNQK